MELKVQIPFQQLLNAVKTLTTAQKAELRHELTEEQPAKNDKAAFIDMLINGPVLSDKEIQTIEDNHKSLAKWRTKN